MDLPSASDGSISSPLERLPLHILEYICQFVPKHSLASLSLTSSFCNRAATPRRFSRIKLTIRDKEKLQGDLQKWSDSLSRGGGDRFRHVRRVVVLGFMRDGGEFQATPTRQRLDMPVDDDGNTDSDSDSDTDGDGTTWFALDTPRSTEGHKRAQHEAWLPFADFLGQLPALKDLVYTCANQVPACLLAALHKYHPRSRLHVHTFNLRSLHQERDNLHDIDPDELALATSPCLYSIHATCEACDADGRLSFNLEAVESMVSGAAPGLRRVHLCHSPSSNSLAQLEAIQAPPVVWPGFFPASTPSPSQTKSKARLETLALSGDCSGEFYLPDWNNRTDFAYLVHLKLSCFLSPPALEFLASLAAAAKFRSLQTLTLFVTSEDPDDHNPATLDPPASLFLAAVPPLKSLRLSGYFGALTTSAVLHRHAATLHALHLLPSAPNYADFLPTADPPPQSFPYNPLGHAIAVRCRSLRSLSLRVHRHQGAPEETAVYRALGTLPHLTNLTLLLDCTLVPLTMPPAGDEDATVRAALANSAVDATLARAIWDEITSGGHAPLLRLRIEPEIGEIDVLDYDEMARWVARTWVCRVGNGGRVEVREDRRGGCFESEESLEESRDDLERVDEECKDLWREMWPGEEGGDWRDEWKSLPLRR